MRSRELNKAYFIKLFKEETGIAFTTVIFFVAIIMIIAATVSFVTTSQISNTQTQSERTLAFNIAEAGIERAISYYGQNYPIVIPTVNTVVYENEPLNDGTYSTYIIEDPDRPGNILMSSIATFKGQKRKLLVSLRGVPAVFNYAIASNAPELELEGDDHAGTGFALINGNIHANGSIDIDGGQIFTNTATYWDGSAWVANPYYDPSWTVTATGGINPVDPTYIGNNQTGVSSIDFPKVDYAYYNDQSNFSKAEVFNYGGGQESWTVAEFNAQFAPTAPYTSSIVITNGDIDLSGSGTITATILTGSSADNLGRATIMADQGGSINFFPPLNLAIVAERYEVGGTVNFGTEENGAIVIVTEEFEVEPDSGDTPADITMWGTLILGQDNDSTVDFELDRTGDYPNKITINYTETVHKNLPAGWSNFGVTLMYKDNFREVRPD